MHELFDPVRRETSICYQAGKKLINITVVGIYQSIPKIEFLAPQL